LRFLFDKLPQTSEADLEKLFPWNINIGEIAEQFAKQDAVISIKAKHLKA
jgi:hypothetical protein